MTNDVVLTLDRQRVVLDPRGASLKAYHLGEWPVIWGYDAAPKAGQGDVLMPFPSRLAHGRYTFDGVTYQLPPNDAESPHAIHGFLRHVTWRLANATRMSARFEIETRGDQNPGYPFDLRVAVTYSLSGDGLRTSFEVENLGRAAAPFGAGFHPYFSLGAAVDDVELGLPAVRALEFRDFLPTGEVKDVAGTDLDFRTPRPIGARKLGACLTDLARGGRGLAVVTLAQVSGPRRITLRLGEIFRYVVVYSGDAIAPPDRRRALAVEPLTCATDAFNHPAWGLIRLDPGQAVRGSYEIEPRA